MKKIFWMLLIAMFIPAVAGAQDVTPAMNRRAALIQKYVQRSLTAEKFLEAAKKGDVATIELVSDVSFFRAQDKFGNNCFHLAKNASTLHVIAKVARSLDDDYSILFAELRNQRNNFGETPLMAHINRGQADTFRQLYPHSDLARVIKDVSAVNKGGALDTVVAIRQQAARPFAQDNSGRTVAQAALANQDKPGMGQVVEFFQNNAPYLFN